jgi:SNF2 family DNA or RNA helicase
MLVSKPNRSVLVPYSQVEGLFPDAQCIEHEGTKLAIIPHAPREHIQLRAAGLEMPPPILSYYDFEGGKPFNVQKHTVALMTSNTRAYVLNDMGTGKTRAALWAWRYLHRSGCAGKLLIVAPLSTLKFTWLHEVLVAMPHVKAAVLHGSRVKRLQLLMGDYDIYIINHDGLKTIIDELHARTDIDTLVIDELAVYRNNSMRNKMMRVFAKRFTWVWGMTGRPMPQAPTDVWNQCKILTPKSCPPYFRHARSALMLQVSQFKWVPRDNAIETAFSWMQPAVRYSLDDVVELPEAIHRTIDVDMSFEQQTVYRKMTNEFAAFVKDRHINAANAGVLMNKLLQVGAGYVYTYNPEHVVLDSKTRQDALLEIIEEAPHKLIVFAPWKHLLRGLTELFDAQKTRDGEPKFDYAVVDGETKHREKIFSAFQSTTQYRVLLAHPSCVHHGLTLTAASTIVWYSPTTSLEIYEQANARIRRVGQKHKQQFLHLQSTTVEKKIYKMLQTKANLQDEFLALIRAANGEIDF